MNRTGTHTYWTLYSRNSQNTVWSEDFRSKRQAEKRMKEFQDKGYKFELKRNISYAEPDFERLHLYSARKKKLKT